MKIKRINTLYLTFWTLILLLILKFIAIIEFETTADYLFFFPLWTVIFMINVLLIGLYDKVIEEGLSKLEYRFWQEEA